MGLLKEARRQAKAAKNGRKDKQKGQLKALREQLAAAKQEAKTAKRDLLQATKIKRAEGLPNRPETRAPRMHSCLSRFPLKRVHATEEKTEASEAMSDPSGYCKALVGEMITRLSIEEKRSLWLALRHLGTLSVGTVCAGTDCPVVVLHCLEIVARAELDPIFGNSMLSVDHQFSSEIDDKKRAFLEDLIEGMQKSYGDIGELSGDQAANLRNHSAMEDIPSVKLVIGGFPCKDVSSLNTARADNKFVVQMQDGKTGGTFAKILKYLQRHGDSVLMGMWENVVGLASPPKAPKGSDIKYTVHDSNLAATLEALQEVVQHVGFAFQVDPRNYGHPQSRPRLYLPSFKEAFLQSIECSQEAMYAKLGKFMDLFSGGYGLVPIKKLLLSRHHPILVEYLKKLSEKASDPDTDIGVAPDADGAEDEASGGWVGLQAYCKQTTYTSALFGQVVS